MHAAAPFIAPPVSDAVQCAVRAALEQVSPGATAAGPGRWRLDGAGGRRARVSVCVDEGWLVVERALTGTRLWRPAQARRVGWRALAPGRALPAGARPVLPPGGLNLCLRAERALAPGGIDDALALARWMGDALSVGALSASRAAARDPEAPGERPLAGQEAGTDLAPLCEEAGWPATPRAATHEWTVELPARDDAVCVAVVSPVDAGLRLRVALATGAGACAPPHCQAAVAVALLRTAGAVRLVRACATRKEDGIDAALEVRLEPPLAALPLRHALSALAVAHQQVASEVAALAGDEALARTYLAVQGVR